jgi:hypothetical protein
MWALDYQFHPCELSPQVLVLLFSTLSQAFLEVLAVACPMKCARPFADPGAEVLILVLSLSASKTEPYTPPPPPFSLGKVKLLQSQWLGPVLLHQAHSMY